MEMNNSEVFLLNLLKNPNVLKPVYYNILRNSPKTLDAISLKTAIPEKTLKEEILPSLKALLCLLN